MISPNYQLIERNPTQKELIYIFEDYSTQFLVFISRQIPDYSSHSIDHSINIINNLNNFINNWEIVLTQDEALLLYLAAWIHDIGCVVDRENHHEVSARIMMSSNTIRQLEKKNLGYLKICLKYLILAHRSRYPIDKVFNEYEGVRLRMICAIFRLMDACEICHMKCPKEVYEEIHEKLDEKSSKIWIGHMNIDSLKFKKPYIHVAVADIDKCQFIIDDLKEEIITIEHTFEDNSIVIPIVKTI